ncbi:NUDIX hydrolase [soil metagenome]
MTDISAEVPLRDAATVLLLRDGPEGLEVFMLKRNLRSDFVGGAYVFPGGAVDPADRQADLDGVCEGRSDADASRRLGMESGGLAFWVAAIRESFEEAGVLLAYDRGGTIVDLDDVAGIDRWVEHRTAVDGGARRLIEVCQAEGLRLAVDGMHYFGHWVTPEGAPRRYDTRFFLAAAPTRQTPLHDDHEVIDNEWLRPADGIARVRARELTMMPPTVASLRAISRFDTAADALAAATEITQVPAILPRVVATDGGMRIVLPGDPGYDGGPATIDAPVDWTDLATAGTTGFDQETP